MREREEVNSQNRGRDGTRATHTRALDILDIRASAVRRVENYQLGCFEMAGLGQLELGGMHVTGIDRLVCQWT